MHGHRTNKMLFFSSAGITTFEKLYSNLFTYPLYIGICLLLMLVYSLIFMVLAIYIERINPGEFGVSQRWNYLFRRDYWKPRRSSSARSADSHSELTSKREETIDSTIKNNHWIELNPSVNGSLPALSIHNMTKVRCPISHIAHDFFDVE